MKTNIVKNVVSEIDKSGRLWKIPNIMCGIIIDNKIEDITSWSNPNIATDILSENSIFRIGSNSKSFAGSTLVELVNQYGINLNDPVIEYFPNFQLCDEELTKKVCIRDLVTHHIGLGKLTCSMMGFLNYPSTDIINNMKYLPLAKPFRTSFQYHNGMYLIVEQILNNVAQTSVEQFYIRNFFNNLNMKQTNTSLLMTEGNIASPYVESEGSNILITQSTFSDALGMGTNINSTVVDMTRWVLFNLKLFHHGSANSTYYQQQFHKYVMFKQRENTTHLDKYITWQGYSLGWYIKQFDKFTVYEHLGQVPGYTSYLSFVPELKSGIVILCNKSNMRYPLELIRLSFFNSLVNSTTLGEMRCALFEQTMNYQNELNHKVQSFQRSKLPDSYNAIDLTLINPIYQKVRFVINNSEAFLKFEAVDLTFKCFYANNNIFILIDHLHHFSTLLKLITLDVHLTTKTLEMKIFMDNQHGGLSEVAKHLFR